MSNAKPHEEILNLAHKKVAEKSEFSDEKNCSFEDEPVSSPAKSGYSPFSIDLDDYPDSYEMSCIHSDELPAFEIRSMSPMGRSPSPISFNDTSLDLSTISLQLANETGDLDENSHCASQNNSFDFITLREINEQIKPLSDNDESIKNPADSAELETIFEGVFLETPPRKKSSNRITMQKKLSQNSNKSNNNKGKENQIENQVENEDLSIQCVNRQSLYSVFK